MPIDCPLFQGAKLHPEDLFIDGIEKMSYFQFEGYVEQLSDYLKDYHEKEVIAVSCHNPSFFIAMLIAAMRKKLLVFAIHSRLTPQQKADYLAQTKALYFFDEPIVYDKTRVATLVAPSPYLENQPLTYLLTSGSTSKPKICVHSIGQHFASARACNTHLSYQKEDRWLLNMPLYHVSGLSVVFRTLLARATLILPSENIPFDLVRFSVSHLSCVNTQLLRLLSQPICLEKLKVILLGGASPLFNVVKEAKELKLPLYLTYGLTEMGSQVATSLEPFGPPHPLSHIQLAIDNQNQILVRGSSLFLGYLHENKIRPSLNKRGWFETKDLGVFANQELAIKGRLDNLFISGGENIQPEEVEEALLKYPGILEAIVVPKTHPEFDNEPIGFIRVTSSFDAAHLKSFLKQVLPSFKIPKTFLPLQYSSLKPCRKSLINQLQSSSGSQ